MHARGTARAARTGALHLRELGDLRQLQPALRLGVYVRRDGRQALAEAGHELVVRASRRQLRVQVRLLRRQRVDLPLQRLVLLLLPAL